MKRNCNHQSMDRLSNHKKMIMEELRKKDFRITKQRKIILDIIIDKECTCCKEIYFTATQIDPTIGIATVYRMVNILEEIGVIDRKNLYRIDYQNYLLQDGCTITFSNRETISISHEELLQILEKHYETIHQEKHIIASAVIKKKDKGIKLK